MKGSLYYQTVIRGEKDLMHNSNGADITLTCKGHDRKEIKENQSPPHKAETVVFTCALVLNYRPYKFLK